MRAALLAWLAAWLPAASGCAPRLGPPEIIARTPCVTCAMGVSDTRFACTRQVEGTWRVYDSIECLLRDAEKTAGAAAYLPDYDTQALHPAGSLWVVRGDFTTPMGGGLAAFVSRGAADTVAARSNGRIGRLADFAAAAGREGGP